MTFWKMFKSPNGADSGGSSRREFIGGAAAAGAVATVSAASPALAAGPSFVHGVASGDPLANKVIIWTRVSGRSRSTSVRWMVALDADFAQVMKQGTFVTNSARDYTVKVDVAGLTPATTYFYKFQVDSVTSPTGRTRTLPAAGASIASVKFAIFSCSGFEVGYFNAYKEAAARDDLDAAIHLGDYIYEYPARASGIGTTLADRIDALQPKTEILKLADYRSRHATYRTDPDLQALTAKTPLIAVYDDHEVTNDGWREGAENHQPDEGDWDERKRVALQAYYEWMPVRGGPAFNGDGDPRGVYRDFDWGNLARLIILDTRLAGRDLQFDQTQLLSTYGGLRRDTLDGTAASRARQMMNPEQVTYLQGRLASSTQTWQVIGNQALAFYQPTVDVKGSTVLTAGEKAFLTAILNSLFGAAQTDILLNLAASPSGIPGVLAADAWTGYPTARAQFLGLMAAAARNPIVVTGDSHNAWTANLRGIVSGVTFPIAVEFGGTSVSSGGFESVVPFPPERFAALTVETSNTKSPTDKLIYTDQSRRGYLLLELTPGQARGTHVFVSTAKSRTYTVDTKSFTVAAGAKTAIPA